MRGSPLVRSLLAFVILLALSFPLHRLLQAVETPERTSETGSTVPLATAEPKVHLQVTFTTAPTSFRLLSLGVPVWNEPAPGLEMQRDLALAFPPEGIELVAECTWPPGAQAAARVQLTDPQGVTYERLLWGAGETSRVLSFP